MSKIKTERVVETHGESVSVYTRTHKLNALEERSAGISSKADR
jgi:hypothetical protein